jgi:hypothetical protein
MSGEQAPGVKLFTGGNSSEGELPPGPKQRRAKPGWKRVFLDHLREYGDSPTLAAEAAGVSRQGAWKARRNDPRFRERWEQALEQFKEGLQKLAIDRAKVSDRVLLAVLRAEVPEKYGKRDPKPSKRAQPISVVYIHSGGVAQSGKTPEPVVAPEPVQELPATKPVITRVNIV